MIRVLVVDDSAVLRRLISTVLGAEPDIEVVGTACDGIEAIARVDELRPDAVTLDVEMPRLDGIGAVEQIAQRHPRLPVIMFSTLTEKGAEATLRALSRGASDYVAKPTGAGNVGESMTRVRDELVPRIKALVGARRMSQGTTTAARAARTARAAAAASSQVSRAIKAPEALVIACSTGGPDALTKVLEGLPANFALPVLITQHMPPVFTTQFALRLDRASRLDVREASDGDLVLPGQALLAPGDFHLRLGRSAGRIRATLDQGEKENFCRPAADPLMRSAADAYGGAVLGLVLTGMGQDGLLGAQAIRDAGGRVIVQDEATSVVWGMPGAVANAGIADEILPLEQIAPRLAMLASRGAMEAAAQPV